MAAKRLAPAKAGIAVHGAGRRSSAVSGFKIWLGASVLIAHGAIFDINAKAAMGDKDGCEGDTGSLNLACGEFSHALGSDGTPTAATAVGVDADAAALDSSAFGALAKAKGEDATAIGANSQAAGKGATALGRSAHAMADNAIAIGANTTAGHANSIAIGQGVSTARANQVKIGQDTNAYTLSGINSADSKSTQSGTKYLVTSDGAGNLATASVNMDDIEGLVDDVAEHTTQIASLNTTVGTHTTQIADHETRITSNTNTLNLHTTQISSLDSRTTVNETNIASLDGRVTSLETGLSDLGGELAETRREARQGIAAAIAMSNAPMPSAPGRTSWSTNVGHFKGSTAFGGSLTHRLDLFDDPFAVSLGYSYGGGDSHALRFGLQGEF